MDDLFSHQRAAALAKVAPLPVRMRPKTLEEFVGQQQFIGPGKLLRRQLQADRLTSVIFYGPPGTGKTTLAEVIANVTEAKFEQVNAAAVGVKEIRQVIEQAKDRLLDGGRRTILFIDELHRFNRAQQDVLLPDVENGILLLIGATTENPFFAVNSPLISRSQIFQFEPLASEDIATLIRRAATDRDRGLGSYEIQLEQEAVSFLARICDGDARRALAALEVGVLSIAAEQEDGPIVFDKSVAEQSIQRKAVEYDGTGDSHYDAASALIKSMRGSDPDAAIYWMARMLEGGEDPRFIARRIAICAAEDVGNADPQALMVANAALQVSEFIGLPEAQLPLAQAAIYIATAPKSNASAMAIWSARDDIKNGRTLPVPKHLRDAHYRGAKQFGHGEGYKYSHSSASGHVEQDYLGVDKVFYKPTPRGYEVQIAKYLASLRPEEKVDREPA